MKPRIRDRTQMVGEKGTPLFAAVNQIVQDDEIIEMAGAVLGGKVGEPPDKTDMEGKKNEVNYETGFY